MSHWTQVRYYGDTPLGFVIKSRYRDHFGHLHSGWKSFMALIILSWFSVFIFASQYLLGAYTVGLLIIPIFFLGDYCSFFYSSSPLSRLGQVVGILVVTALGLLLLSSALENITLITISFLFAGLIISTMIRLSMIGLVSIIQESQRR